MNRTELLLNSFKPEVAIVVYKSTMGQDEFYLESHSFNDEGKILEGKPLREETINGMVDVFFDERKNKIKVTGFIPDNVISFDTLPGGQYHLVWHRPAEIRVMHFASQLKLSVGKTWIPATVYVVNRGHLFIYAMKKNSRPELKTALFRAPFHNVSDDGAVCLGSAKVKKPSVNSYENLMKYWEDLFWLSEFTHLNGAKNPTKSELGKVYQKLLKSKTKLKWSDLDELKPAGLSLKQIFK
jgi:PRTRC genetic system protein B